MIARLCMHIDRGSQLGNRLQALMERWEAGCLLRVFEIGTSRSFFLDARLIRFLFR
jgi:hypothetical protein